MTRESVGSKEFQENVGSTGRPGPRETQESEGHGDFRVIQESMAALARRGCLVLRGSASTEKKGSPARVALLDPKVTLGRLALRQITAGRTHRCSFSTRTVTGASSSS